MMISRILMVAAIFLQVFQTYSQDAQELKAAVENKSFVFKAQTLIPQKGGSRTLSPGYEMRVSGDSLVCDLPYFGRVYQPTIGDTDGGLNFTATHFDYQTKVRKKGGWTVTIKTREVRGQPQFNLTISDRGTTTLNVSSTDREAISYNGTLSPNEQ